MEPLIAATKTKIWSSAMPPTSASTDAMRQSPSPDPMTAMADVATAPSRCGDSPIPAALEKARSGGGDLMPPNDGLEEVRRMGEAGGSHPSLSHVVQCDKWLQRMWTQMRGRWMTKGVGRHGVVGWGSDGGHRVRSRRLGRQRAWSVEA
jgi:hypothetical protein